MTPDRYDAMSRAEMDAEQRRRIRNLADALAYVRSGHMHDEEIRAVLRILDGVANGR